MVLNCADDALFTPKSMRQAESILREVFARAGGEERLVVDHYPGLHRFDAKMQEEAFDFFDRCLK